MIIKDAVIVLGVGECLVDVTLTHCALLIDTELPVRTWVEFEAAVVANNSYLTRVNMTNCRLSSTFIEAAKNAINELERIMSK